MGNQGGSSAPVPDPETCEEACPVVESVEELLCGGQLDPRRQLVRHLNNHLREAMIECGMFELMAAREGTGSVTDSTRLQRVNQQLGAWTCEINLDQAELQLLSQSLSRLSRSSWLMMPRTMWRLRRKLKRKSAVSARH
jgi:hypothetical protein